MLAGVFTTVFMAPGERIKCLLQVSFSLSVCLYLSLSLHVIKVVIMYVEYRSRCIKRLVRLNTLAPLTVPRSCTKKEELGTSTEEHLLLY